MAEYIITLDAGTTNTRAVLWDAKAQIAARADATVGVRDTAVDGTNRRLRGTVKRCLERVLSSAGAGYGQVKAVVASGMITSNVGLVEIPHQAAPLGLAELAAAMRSVELPDVCPLPILFIPGVKNSAAAVSYDNFEAMDMMRGEETEAFALLEQYPAGRPYLLVLPGSHMKFVAVDAAGRITGCLTSISGELLSAITNGTIIADAVGRSFVRPDAYDREMVLLGYDTAKTCGVGRACFAARILNQFGEKDTQKLANYILGAALQSDVTGIKNSAALRVDGGAAVIVAGKDPLRQAIADILRHEGFGGLDVAGQGDCPLAARGAYLLARARGLA